MSFCPDSHYVPHPLLAIRPDGFIQLNAVNPNIVVHPLQLAEYLKFDSAVRRCDASVILYVPTSYTEFTTAYNASKGDNPCKFVTEKKKTDSYYNLDTMSIPPSLLTFLFVDPRYGDLHVLGLLDSNGNINQDQLAMIKNAILRPHRDAVKFQARMDSRRQEKANKKRRLKEGAIAGPSRSTHNGKRPAASSASAARASGTASASGASKSNPALPERDAEGEEDEEMLEEFHSS